MNTVLYKIEYLAVLSVSPHRQRARDRLTRGAVQMLLARPFGVYLSPGVDVRLAEMLLAHTLLQGSRRSRHGTAAAGGRKGSWGMLLNRSRHCWLPRRPATPRHGSAPVLGLLVVIIRRSSQLR